MAGNLSTNKIVGALIGIFVAFILYAELVPELQTAGDDLNATGVPFGSIFASGGLVFVLIMVGLLIAVLKTTGMKK